MKVEDLMSIITGQNSVVILSRDGDAVARVKNIEEVPRYLRKIVVDQVRFTENGNIGIHTSYANQLRCLDHLKELITEMQEEIPEDSRVDSVENLNLTLALYLEDIAKECSNMMRAINERKYWDKYL